MRIYFCGLGGVAIGPLAMIAKDMGHDVLGSEDAQYQTLDEVKASGIPVRITKTASYLKQAHANKSIDWFVYTAARSDNYPEVAVAKALGIKTTLRDELLSQLIKDADLKLIGVAGTHGKTTTTAMLVWLFQELGIPVSYSIGTKVSFGPSGRYDPRSQYFVYEADEYHRNFLSYQPYAAVIPSLDYDHPDTYPTLEDYKAAFRQFLTSAHCAYLWTADAEYLGLEANAALHALGADTDISPFKLPGEHNRRNANLAAACAAELLPTADKADVITALNRFPGTQRRFEKLANNLYTDYAHHPAEIKSTIQLALEVNKKLVVVYQPHQNIRQHLVKAGYTDAFKGAAKVFWLPTYLSREDKKLKILTPEDFISGLSDPESAQPAETNEELRSRLNMLRNKGYLVLLMSAGDLDAWARKNLV